VDPPPPVTTTPTPTPTPTPATTPIETTTIPAEGIITITATDLWSEFSVSAIAAESKYKDQILEVTGSVVEVDRENKGFAFLTFDFEVEVPGIGWTWCYSFNPDWEDQLSNVSESQRVTVRGELDKWEGDQLYLKNCYVVK
jgi:hypothetical protein